MPAVASAAAKVRRSPTPSWARVIETSTRAWGANMAIRRSAFDAVGDFDPHRRCWSGDEEEWEQRHLRCGRTHPLRRDGRARPPPRRRRRDAALAHASAVRRGRQAREFDEERGDAPAIAAELRVFAGCLWHTARRACANGPVMAAHSWGRIARARQGRRDRVRGDSAADFLSGESGTVGGRRDALRALVDRAMALRGAVQLLAVRRAARIARTPPRAGALDRARRRTPVHARRWRSCKPDAPLRGRRPRAPARRARKVREPQPAARRSRARTCSTGSW